MLLAGWRGLRHMPYYLCVSGDDDLSFVEQFLEHNALHQRAGPELFDVKRFGQFSQDDGPRARAKGRRVGRTLLVNCRRWRWGFRLIGLVGEAASATQAYH